MNKIKCITSAEAFRKYTDGETFAKITNYDTLSDMWRATLEQYATLPALETGDLCLTYNDLEKRAAEIRAAINLQVSNDKTRIALLAENSVEFVSAFIAIVTSGHSALILPTALADASIKGCCLKYGASAILYSQSLESKTVDLPDSFPTINIESAVNESDPIKECNRNDECVLMFTSGTEGISKVAILSHEAVMQGTVNGCYGYNDVFEQKYILVLPMFHVFGLIRNLLTGLYTGSHLYICHSNKDLFRDIASFKPTMFVTVPAIVELGLNLSKRFNRNMFGADMKTIISGAAPVAPYLVNECAKMGINLCPGYGLTESANLVSGNPESLSKPESVGLPFPNQELRIVNGELWFRGANRMIGYADADSTDSFVDDWFCTGDLAHFDEDGFLYITGRCKEIIVLSNGENISPAEIEAEFNKLDFVQDSQVYEDINSSGEHILVLEIVLRMIDSADDNNTYMTQLQEVNHTLPSYKRINHIIIRDTDFERSPSMKIIRYKKC